MKDYPSIDPISPTLIGRQCCAFHKYDGSNLRFEYSKKKGWHIQGTRRRLFDKSDPDFGSAIELFEKKYGEPLAKAVADFKDFKKPDGFVAFAEFFGPHSFAGWHAVNDLKSIGIKLENNDPKDIVLFDVNINKRGFVGPRNFIRAFGHLHIPNVLWSGILDEETIKNFREGVYGFGDQRPEKVLGQVVQSGPVEGYVLKGGDGFDHTLWLAKVKTLAYLQVLKERFGIGGYQQYWE